MFFQGSVVEAIQASRRELRPLVVLLTGFDQGSRQVQDALIEQEGEEWAQTSIVLALEDDLANTDRAQFADAKNFRAFCPVEQLPTVVMVSPTGATLAKLAGVVGAEELRSQLAAASAAFRQQQQQMLAAQAALLAASAAGVAPATAAPAAPAAPASAPRGAGAAGVEGTEARSADGPSMPEPMSSEGEAAGSLALAGDAGSGMAATAGGGQSQPLPQQEQQQEQQQEAPAEQHASPPDPASTPYRLQFRFTDASTLRADFNGASRLSEVFIAVDEARRAAGRPPLPYVLVQAAPRRVLGAAQADLTLAASGVLPGTSLQVIPHAAAGHQPAPADAAPVDAAPVDAEMQDAAAASGTGGTAAMEAEGGRQEVQQAGQQVGQQAGQLSGSLPAAAAAALSAAPVELSVRLTNGSSLQRSFGTGAKLTAVLDWIDAERTDRGAYKLVQPHPRRTFFSGDLGSSLQELGFSGRVALQLELLPPKPKPKAKPAAVTAPPENKLPHTFDLQFKLTNGEQLRGSFPPEAVLQEVCHYLDTHRTDGGAPYTLVQPYPKRRFSAADMQQSLQALCLQPRQLLLVEAVGPPIVVDTRTGGGWSLGGLLSSAAGFLNPLAYLGGTAGSQQAQQAQQQQQSDAAAAAAAAAERRLAAGSAGGGASGSSGAAHAARKRPFSTTGGPNVHTLASSGGSMDEGDANKYWNGNSTEFGGGPPPGQQ